MNVIRSLCEGIGTRFNGEACQYYTPHDRTCQHLEKEQMEEFWHACRGAFVILYEAVNTYSKKFQKQYPDLPIDEAEDIDFQGIVARLNIHQPDVKNLNVWHKYVDRTVYLELRRKLVKQGLLPRAHVCGTCKYLSKSKPYFCFQAQEVKKKTGVSCAEYRPDLPESFSIDGSTQSRIGADQEQRRLLLEAMKAKLEKESKQPIFAKLSQAVDLLNQRVNSAKPESKTRQRYKRQSEVFLLLHDLLASGIPRKKAENTLTETYRITLKTLQRDIAELKKFLQEKMSPDHTTRYPDPYRGLL